MAQKKKYIGQLISIKYTDRPTPIYGIVIDYNEDWTLMKQKAADYMIDGYILLRHKNIEGFRRDMDEKWYEKVLKLKGINTVSEKESIPMDDLETIVTYLAKQFGVFQFYTKSETACYVGKLKSIDSKKLVINFLTPKAKWGGSMSFRPGDVRVIEFDTDYINSLKLVAGIK